MSSAAVGPSLPDAELCELARKHGTPLYVYDLGRLRHRVAELRAVLPTDGGRLYFATMANDRLPVLRVLPGAGVGACVNSLPHLQLAEVAGFPLSSIQFTSTAITGQDIGRLQRRGVRTNLDSLGQLDAWLCEAGPAAEAGIRINSASLTGSAQSDRIGIAVREIDAALAVAAKGGRRGKITGVHCYLGTNFQRVEQMLPTLRAFFEAAASVPALRYINIGGGIGVDYSHSGVDFGLGEFRSALHEYTTRLRERLQRSVEVIFEPGRSLVASSGTFVTAVSDVKEIGGRLLIGVDGSVAIFPRPLHHPDSPHRIRVLTKEEGSTIGGDQAMVVGRSTFSRDILGFLAIPEALEVGDLLAFDDAGAYCQSMASRFLGQPDPAEIYLDAAQATGLEQSADLRLATLAAG